MSKKTEPLSPESALKIIRTWAAHQLETGQHSLNERHVIDLCDRALLAELERTEVK